MYSFVALTCICLSLSLGRMVVRVWFPESTTSHIFHKEARYDLIVHVDLVTDSQSYLKAKSHHHKYLWVLAINYIPLSTSKLRPLSITYQALGLGEVFLPS